MVLLFSDSHLECPVVGVQENLGERYDLRGAVPTVGAVHQDRPAFPLHRRAHQRGRLQHDGQVLQPTGAFQRRQPAGDNKSRCIMQANLCADIWKEETCDPSPLGARVFLLGGFNVKACCPEITCCESQQLVLTCIF